MDFSHEFPHNTLTTSFSDDFEYIANVHNSQIIIREPLHLEEIAKFTCNGTILSIKWCIDSNLILALVKDKTTGMNIVQIFSVKDKTWDARISEELLGIRNAFFSKNPNFVFVYSFANIRLSIWSLFDGSVRYINYPKYHNKGISYRADDRYVALLERRDAKDYIGIYDTQDWVIKKHFKIETLDAVDISWSSDGQFIAVWENITEYKIMIYSSAGFLVKAYKAYELGLGIKSVEWSPSSQFIAIGSYDGKTRLLNTYTWELTISYEQIKRVTGKTKVFREISTTSWKRPVLNPTIDIALSQNTTTLHYELEPLPFTLPSIKVNMNEPNPKIGISICSFNGTGRYLVTKDDEMPNCLFLWEIGKKLPIMIGYQSHPIQVIKWNPVDLDLLAFIGTDHHVYLWSPKTGLQRFEIPNKLFQPVALEWSSNGFCLLLLTKNSFMIGYPIIPPSE